MTVWTWSLIALCSAGVLLALVSSAIALAGFIRLNRRLVELQASPFVTKLESLQIQIGRFSRISDDVEVLSARAEAAIQRLREAPKASGLDELAAAWRSCALQVRSIIAELS